MINNRFFMLVTRISLLLLVLCFFSSRAAASFYEIKGTVKNSRVPASKLEGWLIRDDGDFGSKYQELQERKIVIDSLENGTDKNAALDQLRIDMAETVRKNAVRRILVYHNGEFYMDTSPGTNYCIVILNQKPIFKKYPALLFWIGRIYFKPGEVLKSQNIFFDDSNAIEW